MPRHTCVASSASIGALVLQDALQSKEEMIIRKPPDGGEPMRIPIDWRMTRLPQAALTQPQLVARELS